MIVIAALAASQLLVNEVAFSKETKELSQSYWDCVAHYAVKMEPSGGSGEEIYIAARHLCREDRLNLDAAIAFDLIKAKSAGSNSDKITVYLEQELRAEVTLTVLAKRAKK